MQRISARLVVVEIILLEELLVVFLITAEVLLAIVSSLLALTNLVHGRMQVARVEKGQHCEENDHIRGSVLDVGIVRLLYTLGLPGLSIVAKRHQ